MNTFDEAAANMEPGQMMIVPSPIPLPGFEELDLTMVSKEPAEFDCSIAGIRIGGLKATDDGRWKFTRI